jgi:tetratricopeptide (TPR) repeat protein
MTRAWQNRIGTVRLETATGPRPSQETVAGRGLLTRARPVAPEEDDNSRTARLAEASRHSDLGRDKAHCGYYTSALLHFNHARRLGLADPTLLLRMVWTLLKTGRIERCINIANDALARHPNNPDVKNTLGLALRELGEFTAAEAVYDELLEAHPRYRSAHINMALLQFRRGNYQRGAEHFEWRFAPTDDSLFAIPERWNEARLAGKRVLLHHEQGLGDTINFLRLADLVADLGADVTALVQRPLLDILKPAFPGITLATQARPSGYDYHAPLLCVLHRLSLTPAVIPQQRRRLTPNAERAEYWRGRLAKHDGLKVGVVYTGQPKQGRNRYRSLPPAGIAQWNHLPGICVFDLQMRAPDRPSLRCWQRAGITNLGTGLDHHRPAFSDTMAILQNLDLVVTCDTSTAHLAGAMGRPVWLALDTASDWRWHQTGNRSNWYESMRLYRQQTRGDWAPVLRQIETDLVELGSLTRDMNHR